VRFLLRATPAATRDLLLYTVSSKRQAPKSHSGIRIRDAKIIWSLHHLSNPCAMRAAKNKTYRISHGLSHHKTWEILFITYLPPHTWFFKWRGVGIHDVITKIYHMSVITLISWKTCDKERYVQIKEKNIIVMVILERLSVNFQLSDEARYYDQWKTLSFIDSLSITCMNEDFCFLIILHSSDFYERIDSVSKEDFSRCEISLWIRHVNMSAY
jgi:hypothetical protein